MTRRPVVASCLAVALLLQFATLAYPDSIPQFIFNDLGPGRPSSINNAGQVVGMRRYGSNWYDWEGILWQDGTYTRMGQFGNGSYATSINDLGQVVGTSMNANDVDRSFLWQNGALQDLNVAGSSDSYATAINNSGQVVGHYIGGGRNAYLLNGTSLTQLSANAQVSYQANGINDSGYVVGYKWNPMFYHSAFLWYNGLCTVLPSLPAMLPDGSDSGALAINNLGQIVGYQVAKDGKSHAVLWDGGTAKDLGVIGTAAQAEDINLYGQIVGLYRYPNAYTDTRACLWQDNVMYNLNDLISQPGYLLTDATAINDLGQIVCKSTYNGEDRMIRLDPIPEPASLCLLSLGALALLCRKPR